ncbi:NAD(P)-binding protein [Ascobolus immersus RN42]|uniref:NAD(P)-binding protein n=1 Tax=Ascobolus immersus RN42 TaxID=1160509 RepID=A0A3N4I8U8_ASCIM|nr:NAD(P)-binding protein [Ascobolus immersus RN42]
MSAPQPYTPSDNTPVLPLFSLKGRTAIISGAGAGIGLAVADAYAEAGANVAIWYNSNKAAIERASEISSKYGVTCKAYSVNVQDAEAVAKAVDQAVEDLGGRLDIFVANAGVPWTKGPIVELELKDAVAEYHKVVRSDLDGVFFCAHAAGRWFKKQGSGSFIATASMSGHIVNVPQLQAAYNAAKAGVIHLCRSLAVEWAGFARVNTVSPGYIKTDISKFVPEEVQKKWEGLTPVGRQGLANELKGAYLYLASDAGSYTTGSDIRVDGGYTAP